MKPFLATSEASPRLGRSGRPQRRCGFSLTDLLAIAACVSLLGAVLLAYLVAAAAKARLTTCTANLAKVNQAVLAYAGDNHQHLPSPIAGDKQNIWWFYKEQVKSYAGLRGESSANDTLFACPDDRGYSDPIPFHQNARFDFNSYVFNGVTLPGMPNIAGLSLPAINQPRRTLLVMEWTAHAPLSWHKSRTARRNSPFYCDAKSVVGFVDGHVSFIPIYYDGYNAAYTQDPIATYEYQYSAK
jgi:type II secretory pathway pseudopilin PulG